MRFGQKNCTPYITIDEQIWPKMTEIYDQRYSFEYKKKQDNFLDWKWLFYEH